MTTTAPDKPKHSPWGASKFEQIMLCPGSVVAQEGLPNTTSVYAAEGTAAHQVLTWALQQDKNAADFVGQEIAVDDGGMTYTFAIDDEMAQAVQVCIDYVRDTLDDGMLLVDQAVDYSPYLGLPDGEAYGTADVAYLRPDGELVVLDYKHGRGVEVDATENPQIMLYALGTLNALNAIGMADDVTSVRLCISQPRVKAAVSEWRTTVGELLAWAAGPATDAVARVLAAQNRTPVMGDGGFSLSYLAPGEKQCKFCRAKATCPALREASLEGPFGGTIDVGSASPDEFAAVQEIEVQPGDQTADWLAALLSKVDMIEDWCKAVRAEAERRMLAGEDLPGYKLVQGKRGARQWADKAAAEELLRKTFRLPVEKAYDLTLISPTTAEKLFKAGDIGPRQWPKAQGLITQPEGKLHVAPVSDKREAITVRPVVEEFENLADDFSDLA